METDKKNKQILNKLSHMVLTCLCYMSQKEGCEKGLESSKYAVSGPGDFHLYFSRTNLAELPGLKRDDHREREVYLCEN